MYAQRFSLQWKKTVNAENESKYKNKTKRNPKTTQEHQTVQGIIMWKLVEPYTFVTICIVIQFYTEECDILTKDLYKKVS